MNERKNNLEEICLYHKISRLQRKHEYERGLENSNIFGFNKVGCYQCLGYNKMCTSYITQKMINEGYFK